MVMIITYRDLINCLEKDINHTSEIPSFIKMPLEFVKGNRRAWSKFWFIVLLRHMEYCENNKKYLFSKIRYVLFKHIFQKYQIKTQLFIHPNTIDEGLNIEHPGFVWIDSTSKIGKNCTILPRVLLGKKNPKVSPPAIFIGNNCYIGTGSTILGPVKIGDNVIIAAGSVVINDIPDNCMVAGNPAVVKKRNIKPYI